MRVTVCELSNRSAGWAGAFEADWAALCDHTRAEKSELVLLPEMPFHSWLAAIRDADAAEWEAAVRSHSDWAARLPELGCATVVSTRPVVQDPAGDRFNEGYVSIGAAAAAVHRKRYLPDEAGFWEASWYSPGDGDFELFDGKFFKLGFAICTELWFMRHARDYCEQGIQLLACPRATLAPSTGKWLAGGRTAAVVSGAFCLSSNFSGQAGGADAWGGAGWIIEPEEGEVLGITSRQEPFLTLDIDLGIADQAKETYPRYVRG